MAESLGDLRNSALIVDNYDSFTFNLAQYLGALGVDTRVVRNDATTPAEVVEARPRLLVLSPGPGRPEDAGICVELVGAAAAEAIPLLGVCLGHQAIAVAFGGAVVGAPVLMHGKRSAVDHDGRGVFAGIASPMTATRYHSLVADRTAVPDCLAISATTGDGTVMGLRHRRHLIEGVQFHPESIGTPDGLALLANMVSMASPAAAAAGAR